MKEKVIIVICEPRSVYDSCFLDITNDKEQVKIVENLAKIKELKKVDLLFYASVSPVGSNNENATIDYDFRSLKTAHILMSYIEGYYEDGKPYFNDSLQMGPCFYYDGVVNLNKSGGFGAYCLDKTKDLRPPQEKVMSYIASMQERYDILEVIFINDKGYSMPLIDMAAIRQMGIKTVFIKPAKPYVPNPSYYHSSSNETIIESSKVVAYGVNECLEKHINYLEENLSENR